MRHYLRTLSLLAVAAIFTFAAPRALAAVTLTETDTTWVFENDYLQIAITKSNGRTSSVNKKTGEGAGGNQSAATASFLTRINSRAPSYTTVTPNVDGDDSDAKRSLLFEGDVEVVANSGQFFRFRTIYRLKDNSKVFEVDIAAKNNTGSPWNPPNPQAGVQSIYYTTVGGSSSLNDEVRVKTTEGIDVAPGTTTGTTYWWGDAPSTETPRAELIEGWMAAVDNVNTVINAWTWDHNIQKQYSRSGVTANKVYATGNRFQLEPLFLNIAADDTLAFKYHLIVDDGITDVSYAAPDSVIAGLSFGSIAYSQGATATVAIQLNSTKLADANYDVKNIRLLNAETGAKVADLAPLTNVALAANAHFSVNRQVSLSIAPGTYLVKGDLYPAGGAEPITTLISRTITVNQADVKVALVEDPTTGNWLLENEVMRIVLTKDGEGQSFEFKYQDGTRSQVNPAWQVFRDYIQPEGTNWRFKDYQIQADPFGTDTPTRKSISFANAYNTFAFLTKTFTLESLSRSLQVDYKVFNDQFDPVNGQGFYTAVALAPGGSGNADDQLTARTVEGLAAPHTASTRHWFGAAPPATQDGTMVVGDKPELAEGWFGVADRSVTDAIALTWDMAKQQQYRITPTDGTTPVTVNSIYQAGGFNRHIVEPHFTGLAVGATLETTMYAVGDTGFKLVGYAEGKRVMAGVWTDQQTVAQGGTLGVEATISNVGVTPRTFSLKNIRLRRAADNVTSVFGADQNDIALDPADRATRDLSATVANETAEGEYVVLADLYEGAAKVATLESLPFTVTPPVVVPGDLTNDGVVDSADVALGLQIVGGLVSATETHAARGDLNGDAQITLEDITAIARIANGL